MVEEKRGSYKGYTESRGKSSIAYAKKALKRIPLDVQKDKYDQIKAAAAAAGETVNGYIKGAIDDRIARDTKKEGA